MAFKECSENAKPNLVICRSRLWLCTLFLLRDAAMLAWTWESYNSVRLSVTRTVDILTPHERAISHQQWLVGDAPSCLKFALKVTHPLRKTPTSDRFPLITSQPQDIAKKVKLWRIGSRPRAFQRAIDGVRMLRGFSVIAELPVTFWCCAVLRL